MQSRGAHLRPWVYEQKERIKANVIYDTSAEKKYWREEMESADLCKRVNLLHNQNLHKSADFSATVSGRDNQ